MLAGAGAGVACTGLGAGAGVGAGRAAAGGAPFSSRVSSSAVWDWGPDWAWAAMGATIDRTATRDTVFMP